MNTAAEYIKKLEEAMKTLQAENGISSASPRICASMYILILLYI